MTKVVGIRFKRACKVRDYECGEHLRLVPGDFVIVEVEKGLGMGSVASTPREASRQTRPRSLKKVIRKADDADMERLRFNTQREKESLAVCSKKIKAYGLPMKLVRAEYLFDSSKAIFYFTSDSRVDFRRLVKDLASCFHTRIEMRQIGVRDEAKMLGGIGPCGRELCCSSFLPDFTPVTIKMAKQQNLALNPAKISGVCGRLMCCLSYEHRGYSGPSGNGRHGKKPGGDRKPGGERRGGGRRRAGSEKKARNERSSETAKKSADSANNDKSENHGCNGCTNH
ncbi:MAG: stage 0 sporulation family protein [Thermodesulfobacteriota bacterium]